LNAPLAHDSVGASVTEGDGVGSTVGSGVGSSDGASGQNV